MLWNRPVGPESEEAAILRRFMQGAIGDELRALGTLSQLSPDARDAMQP